jgi:superfamily II DNA or RNA helicase
MSAHASPAGEPVIRTFEELERAIAAYPESENKARGTAFEALVQRFLERDPAIRSGQGIERVWLWADWPDRVRHYPQEPEGLGVDHVIETRDGSLVAVQAKFVSDPRHSTRYEDLASFINRVTSPGSPFSAGLLVSNADTIAKKVEREFVAARTIGVVLRDVLLDARIDWSPDAPAAPRPPCTRRPDQIDAVADVVRVLGEHDRTRLVAACGTGKTLMAYWTARDLAAERILVLLPSLALVRQFRTEWAEAANRDGWNPVVYAVCSERDVNGADAALMRADELGVRMVATPDTDPAVIADWLRRPGPSIVFSTYQSSPRIAEAMADATIPPFDLLVADEAHNIVSAEASSAFRAALDGERLRARRRLFATATEKIFSNRLKENAGEEGLDLVSMDDLEHFGPLAHQISFGRAITEGLITDYRIVIAEIAEDDPQIAGLIAERRFVDAAGLPNTDAATLAAGLALSRAATDLGFRRMISFHTRAKRGSGSTSTAGAEAFAELVDELEPTWRVAFVSGEQPTATRSEIVRSTLALTTGERGLVTNARCLGEGVDLPDLEAVAFVDPRSSVIDIVQSASRALRRPKTIEKRLGYIVIPVVVPKGADLEAALASDAYAQVFQVVRAMRAHDERLAEKIDALKIGRGARSAASAISATIVRSPEVGSYEIDLATWRERISIAIVDHTYDGWEVSLAALRVFREREGHARVPTAHREGELLLGNWVATQRKAHKGGKLSPERTAALEALGMIWDPLESDFQENLAALCAFFEREGHVRVPPAHREGDLPLGSWVGSQRTVYKKGALSPERTAALEALGMIWDPLESDFQENLAALRAFSEREGHVRVPSTHREGEMLLGSWLNTQRTVYKKGKLAPERIAALESLGMIWDQIEQFFQDNLAALRAFSEREGHARVPFTHREGELQLGTWVSNQRKAHKNGQLSPERTAALEALGMIWDPLESDFQENLAALRSFSEREGHARVPKAHREGELQLGSWVSHQRIVYKRGKLSPNRIAALEALGMVWGGKKGGRRSSRR